VVSHGGSARQVRSPGGKRLRAKGPAQELFHAHLPGRMLFTANVMCCELTTHVDSSVTDYETG